MVAICSLVLTSCTDNVRTRMYGGKEDLVLQKNEIVVGATFKEADLWVITQDTVTGISYMREKSNWGILEGQITFLPGK